MPLLARSFRSVLVPSLLSLLTSVVAACGAADDVADPAAFDALDGGALPPRPRGTIPTCITYPCTTGTTTPDPSTYLPTCTAALNAKIASLALDVRAALGADEGGTWPHWSANGYATCFHPFTTGTVEWSAASGAHEIHGPVFQKWAMLGYEDAVVGMPTTDDVITYLLSDHNDFTNGAIFWDASWSLPAYEVRQPIARRYESEPSYQTTLGRPVADTAMLNGAAGFGYYNHFSLTPTAGAWSANASVYSSSAGTFVVRGAIRARWSQIAWEAGPLGYPTSEEMGGQPACKQPGCGAGSMQRFQHANIWSAPPLGGHEVPPEVETAWMSAGGPGGCYGYPIGAPTGSSQAFEGGTFTYVAGVMGSAHATAACCGGSSAACCSGSAYVCGSGLACDTGTCQPAAPPPPTCGSAGLPCCTIGAACTGAASNPLTCQSGVCRPTTTPACGGLSQACCNGSTCGGTLGCVNGTCIACGYTPGAPCCANDDCRSPGGLTCVAGSCWQCGDFNQPCCSSGSACQTDNLGCYEGTCSDADAGK